MDEYFTTSPKQKKKAEKRQLTYLNAYDKCQDLVMKRKNCWNGSLEGKQTEDCLVEELAEKKCLASTLCPNLYKNFYEYTECHLWAEAFAHKDEKQYIEGRARINNDRAMVYMCREIVQDLAKEMSKYSKYRLESLEGELFLKKEGFVR